MHRRTTTAALLLTVAVSALSGCVTVQRQAAPGPPPDTAPSQPAAPRTDGSAEPRVVQAPAREALEMVGPSRHPHRPGPGASHRPPAPPAPHPPPAPPAAPRTAPRPDRPDHPRHARTGVPDVTRAVPKAPDVCALGKRYGGWHKDSPEAVICGRAYGR
ncbi:hypothetical protein OIB37_06415 [Streptomyces sp. NBC_00820]|uniref:hypothetical protein n=1 Tax=Streptomyces sp. NBC_00820 TaxID=2975842 RepID=UPI002ED248CE|nr:hypothetical protein OIB37_06415 [Streptomyces sp. NBC_00820]